MNSFATMANLISGGSSTTVIVSEHEHSHPAVRSTFALADWLESVDPATNIVTNCGCRLLTSVSRYITSS